MPFHHRFLATLATLAVLLLPAAAGAELRVDITRGNIEPLPVAVPEFFGADEASKRFGADIARVITDDLERSGLFRPVDARGQVV